jgi:hypothetical protein
MQRCTIFFIIVNALHVSGSFSAHHQELKNCTHSIWYMSSLLAATASGSSKQAWHMRLWWSRGSVLAFGTQVRGFKPGRSRRIFQGEKILGTPSFRGELKPSVPFRRFMACKRSLNATWKSGISGKIHRPFLAHTVPPLATRLSGETTSGESWNI